MPDQYPVIAEALTAENPPVRPRPCDPLRQDFGSRVAPTSPLMSATVKKPGQARVRKREQRCCAC
jgi:hypothetical protein